MIEYDEIKLPSQLVDRGAAKVVERAGQPVDLHVGELRRERLGGGQQRVEPSRVIPSNSRQRGHLQNRGGKEIS
jgi:hypothetical protein